MGGKIIKKNNNSPIKLAIISLVLGIVPGILTILVFNEYPLRLFPLAFQRYVLANYFCFLAS